MANSTIVKERTPAFHPEIFEEAREAVITLRNLRKYLSSAELETLEILLDKNAVRQLSKSLKEAESGKLERFEKIL
ncbi:MAG: hypothetical protein ABH813_00715 [Patescibacteria group bacterium]